jgi:hypothetical protein
MTADDADRADAADHSAWRESASLLTQKTLGSRRKVSGASTNDRLNPLNPPHPLSPFVLDLSGTELRRIDLPAIQADPAITPLAAFAMSSATNSGRDT